MMAAERIDYRVGQHVGFVDVAKRTELPLPNMFFILRVTPGRDAKVIQAFDRRDISAWSPQLVRIKDRRTGGEARRPHLGKRIVKPMLPGLIFIPDFDAHRVERIDYVESWLQLGPRVATLSPADMKILREIEAKLNVPLGRSVGDLVRVTKGPLAHFVGNIKRLDSGGRVTLFIESLMSGASVTLDEAQVEPASTPQAG
jgi:transcriptional antiterminator NusG